MQTVVENEKLQKVEVELSATFVRMWQAVMADSTQTLEESIVENLKQDLEMGIEAL